MGKLTKEDEAFMRGTAKLAHDAGEFALRAVGAEKIVSEAVHSDKLEEHTRVIFTTKVPVFVNGVATLKGTGNGHSYIASVDAAAFNDLCGDEFRVTVTRDDGKVFDISRVNIVPVKKRDDGRVLMKLEVNEEAWCSKDDVCVPFVVSSSVLGLAYEAGKRPSQQDALVLMRITVILGKIWDTVDFEYDGILIPECHPMFADGGVPMLVLTMAHPSYSDVCCFAVTAAATVLVGTYVSNSKGKGIYKPHAVRSPEAVVGFLMSVYQGDETAHSSSRPC